MYYSAAGSENKNILAFMTCDNCFYGHCLYRNTEKMVYISIKKDSVETYLGQLKRIPIVY